MNDSEIILTEDEIDAVQSCCNRTDCSGTWDAVAEVVAGRDESLREELAEKLTLIPTHTGDGTMNRHPYDVLHDALRVVRGRCIRDGCTCHSRSEGL